MAFFVAGTGTDVGKTIFSALVMARYAVPKALRYLKPVQTGLPGDRETIMRLTNLETVFFLPEIYRFTLAASPHFAAEQENAAIDRDGLVASLRSHHGQSVVVELAGGLMVPLSRSFTNLDLIRLVGFPPVLVAAMGLGTINHTLLSFRALREAGIEPAGVYFIGRDHALCSDNIRTVIEMTGATLLGHFMLPDGEFSPAEFRKAAEGFDTEGKVAALLS